MKRSERYALNEMAAADMEGIDLTKGTPDSIAKQYVDNYKKRTEKEFTAQAAASFKKQLADREDADAIVAAARKYAGVKEAKSHAVRSQESNAKKAAATAEKNDTMAKNVGAAAKAAADVGIKESIMDNIRKNSGLMMITESSEKKTAKCPTCGGKYLVKTGYCLHCKKKVGTKVKKEVAEDEGDQEPKASCATDSKKKVKK